MKKAAERLEKNGAGMNLGGNFTVVVSYCNFDFMNIDTSQLADGVQQGMEGWGEGHNSLGVWKISENVNNQGRGVLIKREWKEKNFFEMAKMNQSQRNYCNYCRKKENG